MNPTTTIQLPKGLLSAASTDATRPEMCGAFIDAEKRAIVVTNGSVMVTHPIPGDAPITPGFIGPILWKVAKASHPKGMMFLDYGAALLNGVSIALPEAFPPFPHWQQVFPLDPPAYRITLSPVFIAAIADAIGYNQKSGITFEFGADGHSPCILTHGDTRSVLMPMRGEKECGILGGVIDKGAGREIVSLKARIKELSERSDSTTPAGSAQQDAALIESLTAELHQGRARIMELEARLAGKLAAAPPPPAAPGVKPLDSKGRPEKREKKPVRSATAPPTLTRNEIHNGIELRWDGKPDETTLATLKARRWRWLAGKPGQPWIIRYTEEEWLFANALANGTAYTPMPMPPPEMPAAETPAPTPAAPPNFAGDPDIISLF